MSEDHLTWQDCGRFIASLIQQSRDNRFFLGKREEKRNFVYKMFVLMYIYNNLYKFFTFI